MAEPDESIGERFASERRALVEQIRHSARRNGIVLSEPALSAIGRAPRERFVPVSRRHEAYTDQALPIGQSQSISQPTMVAWMTTLMNLAGHETVLEIGAGSGYQAMVLSILLDRGRVITLERLPHLAKLAHRRLEILGASNVTVIEGDGSLGWREKAPYDRILVTAAAPRVPEALLEELAPGGRLVAPIGSRDIQELVTIDLLESGECNTAYHGRCAFVPLVGAQGWRKR
jgi:protein-L-isoaspartate(D-aspartate) O-methyltransferase